MKVLGIDPSLRNFGYALMEIDSEGKIVSLDKLYLVQTASADDKKKVRKNSDDIRRCREQVEGLRKMTKQASMAFVEVPVGSKSARSMASYGACVGILASCDIPMIQLTPYEVKMASVGTKTATKKEMIDWATQKHPHKDWLRRGGSLVTKNEHLADAVACVYAGVLTDDFRSALAILRFAA